MYKPMRLRRSWQLAGLGLAMMVTGQAQALRCGHELIQVGDFSMDVLEKCGEPDQISEHRKLKGRLLRHPYGALEEYQAEEVLVQEWVYNFGRRKFKQLLEFEDGELKKISRLGYGYN